MCGGGGGGGGVATGLHTIECRPGTLLPGSAVHCSKFGEVNL